MKMNTYKKSPNGWLSLALMGLTAFVVNNGQAAGLDLGTFDTTAEVNAVGGGYPVSYTHLTLPKNREV